jgi:hypothetical protein
MISAKWIRVLQVQSRSGLEECVLAGYAINVQDAM